MYTSPAHRKYFDLKIILCLLGILVTTFFVTSVFAQHHENKHQYLSFGFGGTFSAPLNEFYHQSEQMLAWGFLGDIFYHPKKFNKLSFGPGFSYLNYGILKYLQEVDIGGQLREMETFRKFNIYFPYLAVKLMPLDKFRIVPLFEAFAGPRAFTTVSTYSYDTPHVPWQVAFDEDANQETVRETEYVDWTWGYGFSVGTNYFISRYVELELIIKYLEGGNVSYLLMKDITRDPVNGEFIYDPRQSETDMLMLNLGIRFSFF